jgi:hypothetical protein
LTCGAASRRQLSRVASSAPSPPRLTATTSALPSRAHELPGKRVLLFRIRGGPAGEGFEFEQVRFDEKTPTSSAAPNASPDVSSTTRVARLFAFSATRA